MMARLDVPPIIFSQRQVSSPSRVKSTMGDSNSFTFAIKIIATTFGVLGGGFIGNLIAPWVAKTRRGQSGILVGGAAIGGIIMWLAISHTGGGGFGLGPGSGPGKGTGDGSVHKDAAGKDHKDAKADADKDKSTKTQIATATVVVLGGERVKEQRFYVLGNDAPRNRTDLEKVLEEQKSKNEALKELEIVLYTDSVPKDSEAVTRLEEWARGHGMMPKVKLVDKPAP
jgi:hypothetical protein